MKFVVTPAQRAALMERLSAHMRPDVNGGGVADYPVVSLYYDNDERDCYWEKVRGLPSRRKLRVRVYGSRDGRVPPASFIEVKHKCDGRGVKRRVQLPIGQAMRVGEGLWPDGVAFGAAERRIVAEAHDLIVRRRFRPVMVMRYDRSAYAAIDPGSELRVTFDTGIVCRLGNLIPEPDDMGFGGSEPMHPEGEAVFELKTAGCVPYWLSREIAGAGCKLQSHSKYSKALERCDPVLRAMLAPAWRVPTAEGGDTEMEIVSTTPPRELGNGAGPLVG